MRVVAFGTASTGEGYPRLEVVLRGLELNGVHVDRVLCPLFHGHAEKMQLAGGSVTTALQVMRRVVATYSGLGRSYQATPTPDAVLVGALGHLDLLWLRCLPGGDRVPVIFDPFLSLHDTMTGDRGLVKPHGLWAGACLTVDRQACLRADRVLVDTHAVGRRFVEDLKVPAERLVRVLQGQDDRVFRPGPGPAGSAGSSDASGSGRIEVLFAGTYVPLQGVDTILEAAARLQADPIQGQRIGFTLVGHGQMFPAARDRARSLGLENLRFVTDWQPGPALASLLHRADIGLGIFGTSDKADSVIPLKAVAALAVGRPLITRDSPAAREVLAHGRNAWLVPPGNGEALARAIVHLADRPELRAALGAAGRQLFVEQMSPRALGQQLRSVFEVLVEERTRSLATV